MPNLIHSMLEELQGPMMGYWTERMDDLVRQARESVTFTLTPEQYQDLVQVLNTADGAHEDYVRDNRSYGLDDQDNVIDLVEERLMQRKVHHLMREIKRQAEA